MKLLNKNTIKQITLGNNFFFNDSSNINNNNLDYLVEKFISCETMPIMEMFNYAIINNKKLTNLIAENIVIKYAIKKGAVLNKSNTLVAGYGICGKEIAKLLIDESLL